MEEGRKRCSRCGVDHPLHFFRKSRTSRHDFVPTVFRKTVCKACESKERLEKKNAPLQKKARSTINHHAKRMGMTYRGFLRQFDLTLDYIVMLFEREWKLHELGYGCLNCVKPLKNILEDLSLDLIDPKRLPTRSNLRIICLTCNREKGQKDPTQYDLECAEYRHNESTIKSGVQFNLQEQKPSGLSPQLTLL